MAIRRRAEEEFQQTKSELGPQFVTLESLTGGYNGWVSPDILSPQFWAASSNLYSGQFGTIRRARWAPVLNSSTTGYAPNTGRIKSMFSFAPPLVSPTLYFNYDANNIQLWQWTYGGAALSVTRNYNPQGTTLNASMWLGYSAFILKTDGVLREKLFFATPILDLWGVDAADVSPGVTLVAGSTATIVAATGAVRANNIATITTTAPLPAGMVTGGYVQLSGVSDTTFNSATGTAFQITVTGGSSFTFPQVGFPSTSGSGTITLGITKTVGRSYQYEWENANTVHVSAPSPASQYVKYASQTGTIDCIEVGTVAVGSGGITVTGTGTQFSTAWQSRAIWIEGDTGSGSPLTRLVGVVSSPTVLTITGGTFPANLSGKRFQIYDPQSTHVRLYATGDGGSVYFLIARNSWTPAGQTPLAAGLEFNDTAQSEPPNAPFGSEITQIYNIPPPIGKFLDQYQGRPIVYGVAGALQSFFYGNIEATVVGQPPESFSPLNQVTLPIGDGQLNGTANLPTGFILWSNHQDMFKLTGLLSDNTVSNQFQLGATIQRLPYKIGCGSPYATVVSSLGAFWLSADRQVWLFTDHYAPKNVGVPIQDILNRINGTRLAFAKMKIYKSNDRNWLALAIALDSSTFNNKLCILDLDLLASNGQPSFFTFDMATNAPSWYLYDVNCEAIEQAIDGLSTQHLLTADVDLITDLDWQPGYYTVTAEQNVPGNNTLHAVGNENPEVLKTGNWMRAMTNQLPKNLASQGWKWGIFTYDDDTTVIGIANVGNLVQLIPGQNNPSGVLGLEYSPAKFVFGSRPAVKGRRFQIQTIFPNTPGFYELRGFQFGYTNEVAR